MIKKIPVGTIEIMWLRLKWKVIFYGHVYNRDKYVITPIPYGYDSAARYVV